MVQGVRKYLEFMSQHEGYLSKFVLGHGRQWRVTPQTFEGVRGNEGECFHNAAWLAMTRVDVTYVEGYAMSVIPIHHAWCVNTSGEVLDPTWRPNKVVQYFDYFGVPFKTDYLMKCMQKNRVYGVLDPFHCRKTSAALLSGKIKEKVFKDRRFANDQDNTCAA